MVTSYHAQMEVYASQMVFPHGEEGSRLSVFNEVEFLSCPGAEGQERLRRYHPLERFILSFDSSGIGLGQVAVALVQ